MDLDINYIHSLVRDLYWEQRETLAVSNFLNHCDTYLKSKIGNHKAYKNDEIFANRLILAATQAEHL